jgi:hypothetical protein
MGHVALMEKVIEVSRIDIEIPENKRQFNSLKT